jgi:hypothetical protein
LNGRINWVNYEFGKSTMLIRFIFRRVEGWNEVWSEQVAMLSCLKISLRAQYWIDNTICWAAALVLMSAPYF